MKVLHVIPSLANASGPTQALLQLVAHLEQLGVEISLAYLGNRLPDQKTPKLHLGQVHACRASGLRHWGYSPELSRLLHDRAKEFDLLHIHSLWLYPSLIASSVARKYGIPYLLRPAGSLEPQALSRRAGLKQLYFHLCERRIIENAAAIHAVSSQERDHVATMNLGPECVMIPNGIDTTPYESLPPQAEARAHFAISPSRPVLLYVGRIHPIKGLDLLVPILQRLRNRFPDILLLIGGPDQTPYAHELKASYERGGVLPQCQFLGELNAASKALAYRAADLFVLPSLSENFGLVVAEAMAAGTPAIVSDQTPWALLKTRDAGEWLQRDPATWAQTLEQRLNDPGWRQKAGENASKLVRENYAWPEISRQMRELYERIATGSRSATDTPNRLNSVTKP